MEALPGVEVLHRHRQPGGRQSALGGKPHRGHHAAGCQGVFAGGGVAEGHGALPSFLTGDGSLRLQTGIGEELLVVGDRQPTAGGLLPCSEGQGHGPVLQNRAGRHRSGFLCRKGGHRQQSHQHDQNEKSG